MDPCSECGNRSVSVRTEAGLTVHECELCGALSGAPAAVRAVLDLRAARAAGADPRIYALQRQLDGLAGLRVHSTSAGDRAARQWPFVGLQVVDARGLVQIENLCKSLLLSARALSAAWTIEAEYRDALVFALRPRAAAGATADDAEIAAAQADLGILGRALDRDQRLSWWRHPPAGGEPELRAHGRPRPT